MSTLHHPAQLHLWWYAAAGAVIAGILAVLMTSVFASSSGSDDTTPVGPDPSKVWTYHGPPLRSVCFAARPGRPVELAAPGCTAR